MRRALYVAEGTDCRLLSSKSDDIVFCGFTYQTVAYRYRLYLQSTYSRVVLCCCRTVPLWVVLYDTMISSVASRVVSVSLFEGVSGQRPAADQRLAHGQVAAEAGAGDHRRGQQGGARAVRLPPKRCLCVLSCLSVWCFLFFPLTVQIFAHFFLERFFKAVLRLHIYTFRWLIEDDVSRGARIVLSYLAVGI